MYLEAKKQFKEHSNEDNFVKMVDALFRGKLDITDSDLQSLTPADKLELWKLIEGDEEVKQFVKDITKLFGMDKDR